MLPLHLQSESRSLYIQLRDQLRALVHAGDCAMATASRCKWPMRA